MSSEQQLVDKWRSLTPAKQQRVIDFVEHLESEDSDQANEEMLSSEPEIWSPYGTPAVAQALLKLLEEDPGEELD
ncbi:hypothetical protein ACQ4M3_32980 [Leptolyngbya sp. AN03gr2]|uniref:hypothetical protein n=1 Tax=unclassified Leptolyngbya TaxID=2650499 RepID=UPI003D318FED